MSKTATRIGKHRKKPMLSINKKNGNTTPMMAIDPPRERLKKLIERSGKSGSAIARDLGYQTPTGFLRYVQERQQGDKPVPFDIVRKLMPLLVGAGNPPIKPEELLACTDTKPPPKRIADAFLTAAENVDELLRIRYRIEHGAYIKENQQRSLGTSRIASSDRFRVRNQFVSIMQYDHEMVGKRGTQLHCVSPSAWIGPKKGTILVVGLREERSDLIEVSVGLCDSDEPLVVSTIDEDVTNPVVLGVVIGRYEAL